MQRIRDFLARLHPQLQIQNLLEELLGVILNDVPLIKVGIALYLPSANPVQAEAMKKGNGDIIKTFRMTGKEIPEKIEDGMSTIEIVDKSEALGRIYLWRDRAEKTWDFRFLAPYLEVVKVVFCKARIEWELRDTFEKIADMLGEEEKGQRKQGEDEEVTKRFNAEVLRQKEIVQKREKEFLSLFDLSRDGLFIIDSEGRYRAVNKSACELLGHGKDEILHMNAFHQNTDGLGICWKVGLGVERCEFINPRGEMIVVEVSLTPFKYEGEDCFLGTMRDLSISEEPVKKAKEQEEFICKEGNGQKDDVSLAPFENLNDAVLVMDESGIILYCNRKAESIFGYSKGEIVGQSLTKLMPERYRELQFSRLYRLVESEESGARGELVEAEGLRVDGKEFPLEFSISPIQKNGRKQFLLIIRDVSNKRIQ